MKVKTKYKCPKCKSRNLLFLEIYENGLEFVQVDGYIEEAKNETVGNIIRTDIYCQECGHKWTMRKQIGDIFFDPDAHKPKYRKKLTIFDLINH